LLDSRNRERDLMIRYLTILVGLVGLLAAPVAAQDAKQVQAGKRLYESKECAKCHLIAGKGSKISPLDGVASKRSAADIRKWLTATAEMEAALDHKPKVKMSSKIALMKLTDVEVDALVAYLKTLK
jgi:mono/diheme cytochrome c family protein